MHASERSFLSSHGGIQMSQHIIHINAVCILFLALNTRRRGMISSKHDFKRRGRDRSKVDDLLKDEAHKKALYAGG